MCACVRVEKHKVRGISKKHMITVKGFLVVISEIQINYMVLSGEINEYIKKSMA